MFEQETTNEKTYGWWGTENKSSANEKLVFGKVGEGLSLALVRSVINYK